jgi:hypothetical protein
MSEVALSRRKLLIGAGATVVAAALPQISVPKEPIQFIWTIVPPIAGEQLDRMAHLWGVFRQTWVVGSKAYECGDWVIGVEDDDSLRKRLTLEINGVHDETPLRKV